MNLIKLTLATLIFGMSFAMQSNEVEAQIIDCPTGWQYHEFITTDANGCSYILKFCYQCNGFGPAPGEGTIKYYIPEAVDPSDPNCSSAPDMGWVLDEIVDKYMNICDIPPCEGGKLQMTADIPMCRKKIQIAYENPPGTLNVYDYMQTCLDSEYLCVTTFEICYDALLDEYVVDEATITHYIIGTIDCDITPPDFDNKDLYPDDESWESPCWVGYTCPPKFDD